MVSLSRYVIMQVLLAAAFIVQQIVQFLAHWFLARKSCIFNEEQDATERTLRRRGCGTN